MARNTNVDDLLFPISQQPIYLEMGKKRIPGFKAVVRDYGTTTEATFSVVSDNYKLITNHEALEMGKEIHQRLFPNATTDSFEVFNIIAPKTKSFCHIDIIDKNYSINIWKKDTYVPFVRIQNSYNRSRILKFDIGFCRKLCDNGVIFEKGVVSVQLSHSKQTFSGLDLRHIDVSQLKKFVDDFKNLANKSTDIKLPRKYFLPLAAKVMNRNFNLKEKDDKSNAIIQEKLNEFILNIEKYTDKYIHAQDMGETAYAFFNVITDYASNTDTLQAGVINGLQAKCGEWLNLISTEYVKPKFSWEEEIKGFDKLLDLSLTTNTEKTLFD